MKKQQAACSLKSKKKESNNTGRQYRRRTIHGYSIQDHFTSKTPQITAKSARKPLKVISTSKAPSNVLFSACERPNSSTWKEQDTKTVESVVKFKNKLSFVTRKECIGQSSYIGGEKSSDEQGSHSVDYHEDNSEHASSVHSFVSMRRSKKLEFVVKEPSSKPYPIEAKNKLSTIQSDKVNKPSLKTLRRSNSGTLRKSLQEARILASKNNAMTRKQQNTLQSSSELVHPSSSQQGELLLKNSTNKDWMHLFEEPFPRRSPRLSIINTQDYEQLLDNLSPLTSRNNNRKRRSNISPSCLAPKKTHSSNSLEYATKDCGKDSLVLESSARNEQVETPNISTSNSDNSRRRRKSKSGVNRSKRRTVSRQVECNERTKEESEESLENNSMLMEEEIHFPKPPADLTKPGGPFNAVIDFCLPDKDFVKLKLAKIKCVPARHVSKASPCSHKVIAKDLSLQSSSPQPATACMSTSDKTTVSSSIDQETCSPDRECSQDALSCHRHVSGDHLSESILVPMLACSSPYGDTLSGDGFSDSILQPLHGTSHNLPGHQASFSKHSDDCTDSQSLSQSIFESLNHNKKCEENTSEDIASLCTKNSVKVKENKNILFDKESLRYGITKGSGDENRKCPGRSEHVPSSVESVTPSPNQTVLKGLYSKETKTTLEYGSDMSSIVDNDMAQTSINPVIAQDDSTTTSDSLEEASSIDVGYHGNNMSCQKDKGGLHGDGVCYEGDEGCHGKVVSCHGDNTCDFDSTSYWESNNKINGVKYLTDKYLGRDSKQKSGIKLPSGNQCAVDVNKVSQSSECGACAATCSNGNTSLCSNPEALNPILDSFPLCNSTDKFDVNHSPLTVGSTPTHFEKVPQLSCLEHLDKSKTDNESLSEYMDSGRHDDIMFGSKHFPLGSKQPHPASINNIDYAEKDIALNKKENPLSSYNEQFPMTALFSTPLRGLHSEESQDVEPSIGDTATPSGQAKTPVGTSAVVQCEPDESFSPILMQACLQHENSESSPVCSISMFTYTVPVKMEVLAVCLSQWIILWTKVPGQDWTVSKTWTVELDEEFQKVRFLPASSSMALFVGGSMTTTNARVYWCFDKEWHESSLKYNPLDTPVTYKSMCILENNQRSQDMSIVVAGLTGNDCHVVKWILDSLDWKALGQSKLTVPGKSCVLSLCTVEGSSYLILGLTQDKLILWNHQSCDILKVMPLPCSGLHAVEYFHATTQRGLVFMVLICQTLKQKNFGHHCFSIALNPKNNRLARLLNYSSDYPSVSPIQTGSGCGQYIALGYSNGVVGMWNIVSPQSAVDIPAFKGHVDCISFHPTRPIVAFAGGQGCVHLYSLH